MNRSFAKLILSRTAGMPEGLWYQGGHGFTLSKEGLTYPRVSNQKEDTAIRGHAVEDYSEMPRVHMKCFKGFLSVLLEIVLEGLDQL